MPRRSSETVRRAPTAENTSTGPNWDAGTVESVIRSAERKPAGGQHVACVTGLNELAKALTEMVVAADTYQVSSEPILLVAELHGALGLCLHDEARGIGGLLHLRFIGATGKIGDVTDNTLSCVLVVLDRFKRAVLGTSSRFDEVQARILAHALPPVDAAEPSASLVDLIQADLADAKIVCGTQTFRRQDPVRVCFQPFEGRIWISGPSGASGPANRCGASAK